MDEHLMDEHLKRELATRLATPPESPVEAARKFLQSYCSDIDTLQEIRTGIRSMAAVNERTLRAGLSGLEALLEDSSVEPGLLARLVGVDANKGLRDPSDKGAREWLNGVLHILREELNGGT